MRSVQTKADHPGVFLVAGVQTGARAVALTGIGSGALAGGCCGRRRRDAFLRSRSVFGESFEVDRRGANQELEVERGRAAAADAVETVQVLQLGDHALGVCHSSPVSADAGI